MHAAQRGLWCGDLKSLCAGGLKSLCAGGHFPRENGRFSSVAGALSRLSCVIVLLIECVHACVGMRLGAAEDGENYRQSSCLNDAHIIVKPN